MATYKVIQDVEAEDKLLGPLTLRQFIYAAISALCLYLCYLLIIKHADILIIVFLPIALTSAFFAYPWSREQPTEIWALAKIRFFLKPHRRIWDQSGIQELVTITVPKLVNISYTDGLTPTEVNSRLKALADTIDSRGWVIKNVNVNLSSQPSPLASFTSTDRLIDVNSLPQEVPTIDVQAADDILDAKSNPVAQQFDQLINASEQAHHQQLRQQLHDVDDGHAKGQNPPQPSLSNDYWFLNQTQQARDKPDPGYVTFGSDTVVAPGSEDDDPSSTISTPSEKLLNKQLRARHDKPEVAYSHLRTIQPFSKRKASRSTGKKRRAHTTTAPVTPSPDPAILGLANNNDLNVATIARQVHKKTDEPQDEVVISLH